MAEREGFEPSEGITSFAGLANLWFKPLTHLSMSVSLLVIRQKPYVLYTSFSILIQLYHDIPTISMWKLERN